MALRTPLSVTPHLYMGDSTGRPLDMGTVYFGEPDKDPEFYPIELFSDDALTLPLAQPVHTKGGYLYDKGDMVEPHAKELIYSVKVLDSYGRKVFYKGAMMRNSWNDDVIEQINTALVSTAEEAAQIATDVAKEIADKAVMSIGFVTVDSFELGTTLTQRNQALRHAADGRLYRWAGDLPKTVPAGSTPANSGGIGSNAWLEVSDASLSQNLSGLGGASTIGSGVSVFNNMAEFLAAESKIKDGSKVFLHSLHQGLDLEGDGRLYVYSKSNPKAINQTTTSGFLSRDFDGKVFIAEFGATGVDSAVDSPALQKCFDVLRTNNGGVLSMGIKCTYHLRGVFTVNCGDIDWLFNKSTAILGLIWFRWHPLTNKGYGSYKNVSILDGVWHGNTYKDTSEAGTVAGGSIQSDFVQVDNLTIKGNTYIEATYGGHICDAMGCRDVKFTDNTILGSANTPANLAYAEIVQISRSNASGGLGIPPLAESIPYFADLPTLDVTIERNTYKPYTNPTTGIKSYPTRPTGNHGYQAGCNGIKFIKNHVEDVLKQTTVLYRSEMLNFLGYNVTIKDNTFISNNGNGLVFRILGNNKIAEEQGIRPQFEVSGNTFRIKKTETTGTANSIPIVMSYISDSAYRGQNNSQGFDFICKNNEFNVDLKDSTEKQSACVFIDSDVKNFVADIDGNTFKLWGGVDSAIEMTAGGTGLKEGATFKVRNNSFYGLLTSYTIKNRVLHAESGIKALAIEVINNSFYEQVKAADLATNGFFRYIDNKHYGWNLTDYLGTVSGEPLIKIRGTPVLIHSNILEIPLQKEYYADYVGVLPREPISLPSWAMLNPDTMKGFVVLETSARKMLLADGTEVVGSDVVP